MGRQKALNCAGCWGLKKENRYYHEHLIFKRAGTRCLCAVCKHKKTCEDKRRYKCKRYWKYQKHCRYHSCDIYDKLGVLHVCAKR